MLEKIAKSSNAVILATHNVESGKEMKETHV
jgi:hypothetical protein